MGDHRRIGGEFTRFCLTGLLAVVLNNLIIVGLTEILEIHYLWSIIICFFLTTLVGFILNRRWSFRVASRTRQRELRRYAAVTLIGIGTALGGTWGFVQLGVPYYIATLGIAAVLAPINFLLHRVWSFGLRWTDQVGNMS